MYSMRCLIGALYGLLSGLSSDGFESCLSGDTRYNCSIMLGSLAGSTPQRRYPSPLQAQVRPSWNKLEFRIYWSSVVVVCLFFHVIHACFLRMSQKTHIQIYMWLIRPITLTSYGVIPMVFAISNLVAGMKVDYTLGLSCLLSTFFRDPFISFS